MENIHAALYLAIEEILQRLYFALINSKVRLTENYT